MEAVVFIGLQGAGKSPFYRERFFATHVRINLDMVKTRPRERRFLQVCIESRQPFVVRDFAKDSGIITLWFGGQGEARAIPDDKRAEQKVVGSSLP